jgi:hypothetical protein
MLTDLQHCFTSTSHVFLRELKRCRERQDGKGVELINQELDVIHHAMAVSICYTFGAY